jgi:ribonuclease HII
VTAQRFSKPGLCCVGIDEVGRGCLAGPVVAAAVVLDPGRPIAGLKDSKKLSEKKRQSISQLIKQQALAWSVGRAEAAEIDAINILQASLLAMKRAVAGLSIQPDWAWVDGIHFPDLHCTGECVIQGDSTVAEISAASILAKVHRDMEMQYLDAVFPGYQFQRHKAYPTRLHKTLLQTQGCCSAHRQSYAPVQQCLDLKPVSASVNTTN